MTLLRSRLPVLAAAAAALVVGLTACSGGTGDGYAGTSAAAVDPVAATPQVGTILVPTGGGGLLGGVAAAVKALRPEVRVIGVQAEQAAAWPGSLAAGQPVRITDTRTMADGIAVAEPGAVTFEHVSALADEVIREPIGQSLPALLDRIAGAGGGLVPERAEE